MREEPALADFTPMMKQYFDIKSQCSDAILFYRLGDFYEMFFDDAKVASKELDLVLTGRDCGQQDRAPMCGVPYHSCEGYIARLVERGYKVAICEQTEDPATAKGIVRREIIRTITQGTVMESSMLSDEKNNYISAVYIKGETAGISFCDLSTGEMLATFVKSDAETAIINEMGRFSPAEILLSSEAAKNPRIGELLKERFSCRVEIMNKETEDLAGEPGFASAQTGRQFNSSDLSASGISESPEALSAVAALLYYLADTQKTDLSHISTLNFYRRDQFMDLGFTARRNLELCETMLRKEKRGSLLWVLDKTQTSMGARLLRQWLEKPLVDVPTIKRRQRAVAELVAAAPGRDRITALMKSMCDVERLIGRIVYGTANCRDLRALFCAACLLPEIKNELAAFSSPMMKELFCGIDELSDVKELIDRAVSPEPPFSVRDGGMIRDGYDAEVDRLRDIISGGRGTIAGMEADERVKTGIKNLKIGYNKVFGYYIEVTRSYLNLVPQSYIRKQTLANCERYISEQLKELEQTVVGARQRIVALEYEIFCDLRAKVAAEVCRVQQTARRIADLDVLVSFAAAAVGNAYVMPEVDYSDRIDVRDGRHPVVEQMLSSSLFVPNDICLDCGKNRVSIITGPNMAGKSTYMRQAALIVIMAQMGSFVPAKSALIGVVDRVFTRVGASDDLSSGQSTFMVEMSEVADILKNATKKSLLILDEIGRGTSTFDGMAIARAVLEHAANPRKLGAKTMFATHYHELTALEEQLEGVKNYNIAVKKRGDEITFLRKIVPGGADDSYGIEVARLSGIPEAVIARAKSILSELERETQAPVGEKPRGEARDDQVSMADQSLSEVGEALKKANIDTMTPLEALNLVYSLKRLAEGV